MIEEKISAGCEFPVRDWVLALLLAVRLAMRDERVQDSKH
jgi:hypothetical protein